MMLAGIILLINAAGLWVVFLLSKPKKEVKRMMPDSWPMISVWVAARNEAANIQSCLESLLKLDYPEDRIEIMVGNDGSTDETVKIVESIVNSGKPIRVIEIRETLGKARNKANVLAQLAHESKGDYFLFCDADMQVHPAWAKNMVLGFRENIGVVSGGVFIKTTNLFSALQGLDWLFLSTLVNAATRFGIPSTSLGNNMAVSKTAYFKTGGYENLESCITEDLQLYQEILRQGFDPAFVFTAESCSFTHGKMTLNELLIQRKRWMHGVKRLNVFWKTVIFCYAMSFPMALSVAFCTTGFFGPSLLLVWLLSIWCLLARLVKVIGRELGVFANFLFPLYSLIIGVFSLVFYLLPYGNEWKKRKI